MASLKLWILKFIFLLMVQHVLSDQQIQRPDEASKLFRKQLLNSTVKCAEKFKVPPVNLLDVLLDEKPIQFLVNDDIKCYLLCVFQEFNLMDDNGQYNVENIRSLFGKAPKCRFLNVLRNNIDTCIKEDSQNSCEKAYKFAKCFYTHKLLSSSVTPTVLLKEDESKPGNAPLGDL